MPYLILSESYRSDQLQIEESIIEIDNDELMLTAQLEGADAETHVVIQRLVGNCEYDTDLGLDASTTETGSVWSGTVGAALARFKFVSRGFSKLRLIVSQVRGGFSKAFRGARCKLCKLAVKTIVSTLLVQLGVPVAPTGEFDLKGALSALQSAAADFASGAYGQVVQALHGLLPASWWTVVLNLVHAANWLLDATDRFFHDVCVAIGMCLPQPGPPTP